MFNWDLFIQITFLVFLLIILALLIAVLVIGLTAQPPRSMDAMFEFINASTNRNGEVAVDLRVLYRYQSFTKFPDRSAMQKTAKDYLRVSAKLPDGTPWENVAQYMCQDLYASFSVSGVSVQVGLATGEAFVFTKGFVSSLDQF